MNAQWSESSANANITELANWKSKKVENSFSEYLKVLSFNELMNESEHLIEEMTKDQSSLDLFTRTKVMMNEFTVRLEKESRQLAMSVKDLKKDIENKFDR
jgi:predicted nuclease with TOPRIM domain